MPVFKELPVTLLISMRDESVANHFREVDFVGFRHSVGSRFSFGSWFAC